jgi:hypothetical protein
MPSSSTRSRTRARPKQEAPRPVDPDVAQIVMGLARINDPMLTYLMGMVIDRVAELVQAARGAKR